MQPLNIFIPHCSDLLTDFRPHGDGLVANGFIRHLAKRGHNLYVAAERVEVQQPFPSNVHITSLSDRGGVMSRVGYMGRMRRLFRNYKRTIRFDLIHQLNPVFTGTSLALAGENVPLVLGPYVARWPDDPDAATSSLGPLRGVIAGARSTLARLQQSRARILLLTTPAAADRIPDYEAVAARVRMLPHGLDTDLFSPADERSESLSNSVDILFLSNVSQRKGIFDLVRAFGLIAADFPQARLLVAGDGPELVAAKAAVADLPSPEAVVFLGRQTREQSLRLLQSCSIFCQPSLGEPFGMSAAEAMACGKPLIVTKAGGLQYIVDDDGGIRVPVASPDALAGALRTLLRDASLRTGMGEHNRQRIVDWMSWDRVVERLEGIYREVLPAS